MKNFDLFYKDLETLISFKTDYALPEGNYPFGKQTGLALEFILNRAKEMGFNTINYDNYAGEIYLGEGEEIGIIGHIDVVPAGDGWNTDPFTLTQKDGYLFGRGVSDDKLPTLLLLYILKEIKDGYKNPNKKLRLFVGCNEETDWKDIEYLRTKTVMPEYGFSPDGDFPPSYAEKGIYIIEVSIPALKNFSSLTGGTVINAVCAHATAVSNENGIDKTLLEKHGLTLNGNLITSVGVAAHGSTPERGKNAIKPLFEYFLSMGENVKTVLDYLFYDVGGIGKLENEQGKVTLSPDLLSEKDGKVLVACDCRLPAPFDINCVKEILDRSGLEFTIKEKHPTMMVDKNGKFVNALLSSYNAITGKNESAVSMGGSTFARAFKYGCAFGMNFCEYDNNIHNANECVKLTDVERAYEIYKKTLEELLK